MKRIIALNIILLTLSIVLSLSLFISNRPKELNYYDNSTPIVYSPCINIMYENFWNELYPDWKEDHKYDPLISDYFIYLGSIEVDDAISYHVVYYDYAFHTKAGGKDGEPRGTRGVQHALFFDNNYKYLGYSINTFGELKDYRFGKNKLTLFCDEVEATIYFTETQVYEIVGQNKDIIYEADNE